MSKLKRDVRAWAKRVRMSRARLWAVVEGLNHDIPFYEGVLIDGAKVSSVEFLEASDIEVEGIAAGGKAHALKVLKALEDLDALEQENNATKIDFVFFLDRDDDEYLGEFSPNKHAQYTYYCDVEAEIVSASDRAAAVANVFSISRADARRHSPKNPEADLASLWFDWIAMRLAAASCGWSDTRFAQASKINRPIYAAVDDALIEPICARVRAENEDWDETLAVARTHLMAVTSRGDAGRTVKGKWLAPFILHSVAQSLRLEREVPKTSASQFITACLANTDYVRVWHERYENGVGVLLNR